MATTLYLQRFGPALYPTDGLAEAEIRELPSGQMLKVVVTRPRSLPHNRLYWAMLNKVCDNLDQPLKPETLHEWVKLRCGVQEPVRLKSGAVDMVPGSTAFEAMDQAEFNAFFEQAAELLCEHVIPGLNRPDLLKEAREMLGEPA